MLKPKRLCSLSCRFYMVLSWRVSDISLPSRSCWSVLALCFWFLSLCFRFVALFYRLLLTVSRVWRSVNAFAAGLFHLWLQMRSISKRQSLKSLWLRLLICRFRSFVSFSFRISVAWAQNRALFSCAYWLGVIRLPMLHEHKSCLPDVLGPLLRPAFVRFGFGLRSKSVGLQNNCVSSSA